MEVCEAGAIYLVDEKARVEPNLCTECGLCIDACPQSAIVVSGYELQAKYSDELSPQRSFLTLAKTGLSVMGSVLLPVLMSKVSDFLVSKVEDVGAPASQQKTGEKIIRGQGRRIRKRMRKKFSR